MTVDVNGNEVEFEYQAPRIVFEEGEAVSNIINTPDEECVLVMSSVCRDYREPGNQNPVFVLNERGALFRLADGDDADEYKLSCEFRDDKDGNVEVSRYLVTVNGEIVYATPYEVDRSNVDQAHAESIDAFMTALGFKPVK